MPPAKYPAGPVLDPMLVDVLLHRVRSAVTVRRLTTACSAVALLLLAHALTSGPVPSATPAADGPVAELAAAPRSRPAPAARPAPAPRAGGCTGTIALTFDDGPVAGTTAHLVRVLRELKVPATFFMVGSRVAAHPELARLVERSGFLIGNHSWAHEQLTDRSTRQVRASVTGTDRALVRAGVHPTRLMRPPYGAINGRVRAAVAGLGYVPVLWDIDSLDWRSGNPDQIAGRILRSLHHGRNVVLQHDGVDRSPLSVAAVAKVVRGARRHGYCFTGLDRSGLPGYPEPVASVSVKDAPEGRSAVAVVRLDRMAGRRTSVLLAVRSRTATTGEDLPAIRTRVSIPAGRTSATVRIPIRADDVAEPAERAVVAIGDGAGVRIGTGTAVLTIAAQERIGPTRWTPMSGLNRP